MQNLQQVQIDLAPASIWELFIFEINKSKVVLNFFIPDALLGVMNSKSRYNASTNIFENIANQLNMAEVVNKCLTYKRILLDLWNR